MIRAVMPEGVEHMRTTKAEALRPVVIRAVMPEGVEHRALNHNA